MSLRYILGRSGSGKTEFCHNDIINEIGAGGSYALIYIVPEQFSLETENAIINRTGSKGMIRAQVLSFQRLAHRVFAEEGRDNKKTLEDIGKSMLLRKIVYEFKEELAFYKKAADKRGFMTDLSSTITEFFKYGINPDKLDCMAERATDSTLRLKLADLRIIYENYIQAMQENYITNDETLDLLANKIQTSKFLNGAVVWIDSFNGFTPQEQKIISELMKKAAKINIALCVDENEKYFNDFSQTDIFFETKSTINKINRLAEESGIKTENNIFLTENHRLKNFKALSFYEKNFNSYRKCYPYEADRIEIYAAQNIYDEITQAAGKIHRVVRDKGLRYKDIGVVTGSTAEYSKIIKGIFKKHDIPCFIDIKEDILSHPLTELIRSALDISVKNWESDSVFRFLKTGLTGIDRNAVDKVENYVLAYGIRGGKWKKEWTYGFNGRYEMFDKEQLNEQRKQIVALVAEFTEKLKGSKKVSVKEISVNIYKLLDNLNVTEKLGDNTQIWSLIAHVFDKMVEILGDEVMTVSEYARILDAGLETADMGVIPPTRDQVVIGDFERSRLPEIKALFVLGFNEGVVPSAGKAAGLLTDEDKEAFIKAEIELPGGKQKAFGEQFIIYSVLTKPSEYLYISYYQGDLNGKTKQPSPLLTQLKTMFPLLQAKTEPGILSAKAEFGNISGVLRHYEQTGELSGEYKDIYNWFSENPEYKDKLSKLEKFLFNLDRDESLQKDTLKRLYKNGFNASVSQLEQYVECPFAYFVRYTLKAKERKLYQIENVDLGTVFHSIIESFFERVSEEGEDIRLMSKEQLNTMTEKSIKALSEEELKNKSDLMASTPRYGYYMKRIENISKRTIWAISEHIKRGGFEPVMNEMEFKDSLEIELDGNMKMLLNGKIDRVDLLQFDGKDYIKIIDYKSGTAKLDLEKIYYGRQLQLIIYMDAYMNKAVGVISGSEGQPVPAAVFYFRIDNPFIEYTGEFDTVKIEHEILKQFKMSGLVLKDTEIAYSMDNEMKTSSVIIPVAINKDKVIKDSASVLDEGQFNILTKYAAAKTRVIGNEIVAGNINAKPIKQGEQTGCDFCGFNSICGFDREYGGYNVLTKFASYLDVLDEMKEKI